MNISKQIKTLRENLGLNQKEFGDLIGVSGQNVRYWENGNAPRVAKLEEIAEITGATFTIGSGKKIKPKKTS